MIIIVNNLQDRNERKSYSNVEVLLDMQIGMGPLVIDWAKEEPKMGHIYVYC